MSRIRRSFAIVMILCIGLSACATATPISTTTPGPTETLTATASPPTLTSTPTPEPTANPEGAYYQSLTPEQQALFDQTKDMTGEGFTRQFLAEQGLTSYLAYYDRDGEVAFVWNFEQGKPNPALKIENNLLINETSGSHIIWNPELNRAEAQKTLADYFRYARARVCAASAGVQLGNTLESALANPLAQKYLDNGCVVTLRGVSWNNEFHPYSVPNQKLKLFSDTSFVIKFVPEPNNNMALSYLFADPKIYNGWGWEQSDNASAIIATYFNQGAEDLSSYAEYKDMILTRRIARVFRSLFGRAGGSTEPHGAFDTVTSHVIFSDKNLETNNPLIIYSQTR
ncbi:MAG: hypothetical protein CNIPEHKO_02354 [Anaerolineales bacterium]|nr:hypothetical protein [Anaerolineales bacterium]